MEYVFKEKITYKEYLNFIKNYDYLSYTQEELWAKSKEIKNYLIVGVYGNNKLIGLSLILFNKKKDGNEFIIPNGYLIDFSNKELVNFMTNNVIRLAKYYNSYVIYMYPNITKQDNNYMSINSNLEELFKHNNHNMDNTENVLIPLKKNNRKLPKKDLDTMFKDTNYFKQRGVRFEISETVEDLDDFSAFMDNNYFDSNFIGTMMYNYKNRIKILFAKIDLVFYLNYLKDNNINNQYDDEINNITELIPSIGEEVIIGTGLVILPYNTSKNYTELIYNNVKEYTSIDIMNGIVNMAMNIAMDNKCNYLKVSNIDLDKEYYRKYNSIDIEYIGTYYKVIKPVTYWLNKEHVKGKTK